MLLIDLNQLVIANIFSEVGTKDVGNEDLIRHMIVNSIRVYVKKYKKEYGEVVIACDSKNYWRKEIFPFYKANRVATKAASGVDWKVLYGLMDKIRAEIIEHLPYKTVIVDRAEADDIIAVLALRYCSREKVMIVSSDKDFLQLQRHPNIFQYSPILKKDLKADNPDAYLKEHIIRGDRGDGIPNFLSRDNCFVKGERQKPVSKKNLDVWLGQEYEEFCTTDELLRNYKRNQLLINLEFIPAKVTEDILDGYEQAKKHPRNKLLGYFIDKKLKNMIEVIDEF